MLTEINKTIGLLLDTYTTACSTVMASSPMCSKLADQIGVTLQQRGQLSVAVNSEVKP